MPIEDLMFSYANISAFFGSSYCYTVLILIPENSELLPASLFSYYYYDDGIVMDVFGEDD